MDTITNTPTALQTGSAATPQADHVAASQADTSAVSQAGSTTLSQADAPASSQAEGPVSPQVAAPACCRTTHRQPAQQKSLIHRLNRIEGQIRGIRGMLEKDAYCVDILTQVAAVSAALGSFNQLLLDSHIHTCVVRDIQAGKLETTDELMDILHKLMR